MRIVITEKSVLFFKHEDESKLESANDIEDVSITTSSLCKYFIQSAKFYFYFQFILQLKTNSAHLMSMQLESHMKVLSKQ